MINGFYDSKTLDVDTKEKIFRSAIGLSYCTKCEVKYKGNDMYRRIDSELTIDEMIEALKKASDNILDVIDRNTYNRGIVHDEINAGEICWHSTSDKNSNREHWILLYCSLTLNNLEKLVKMYNLNLINW